MSIFLSLKILKSQSAALLTIISTYTLFYCWTFNYAPLWDDSALIEHSVQITKAENIQKTFTGHYLEIIDDFNGTTPYYRPVSLSFLMIEYQIFGGTNLNGYRIIHFLLHLISGILIFFLSGYLFQSTKLETSSSVTPALISSLTFLVLPYTVDAVLFLTDIGDLMVLCFLILSLIIAHYYFQKKSILIATLFFITTTITIGSKETGLSIIPILLLYILFFKPCKSLKDIIIPLLITIISAGTYLLGRTAALKNNSNHLNITEAFSTFFSNIMIALRWALIPHPISLQENKFDSGFNYLWFIGLLLVIALIFTTVKYQKKYSLTLIIIWWWIITISPSILGLQFNNTFDPRYLYLPGASIAVAAGLIFYKSTKIIRLSMAPLLITLALLTFIRIDVWKSSYTLWQQEHFNHPKRISALYNYCAATEELKNYNKAVECYLNTKALSSQKKDRKTEAAANYRLGVLSSKVYKNTTDSIKYLERSIQLYPDFKTFIALGNIFAESGNFEEALVNYEEAEKLKPRNFTVYISLANALTGLKQFDLALKNMENARSLISKSDPKIEEVNRRVKMISDYQKSIEQK
ncbi:MAG: tetratricopeptide repeat protein [Deltaproteobacteria bacterium]|nr:tetratricopeptide repeat protein [Deltaproteobacteria bacterium]